MALSERALAILKTARERGVKIFQPLTVIYPDDADAGELRELVGELGNEESGTFRVIRALGTEDVLYFCDVSSDNDEQFIALADELDETIPFPLFEAPAGYTGETNNAVAFFTNTHPDVQVTPE